MKRKALCLAVAAALCLMLAACAPSVKLADFEDRTERAELGSTYTVRTFAEGDDGSAYSLTCSVKDIGGGTVTVLQNSFTVSSLAGYEIVYTAESLGVSCKVTLEVDDVRKPLIGLGANTAETGVAYDPEIRVSDDSGEQISPEVSLYRIDGEDRTLVEDYVYGETYTFETAGTYLFVVVATDGSGNSETAEHEVLVRSAAVPGEVASFSDEQSLSQIHTEPTEGEMSWLSEYNGAEGVVKYDYHAQWPFFTFTPRMEKEFYAEDDYLVLRMCFAGGDNPVLQETHFGNFDAASGLIDYNQTITTPADGDWRYYVFEIDTLLDLFDRFTTDNYGVRIWWTANSASGNGTIYIDEIFTAKQLQVNFGLEETYDYDQTQAVTINGVAVGAEDAELSYKVTLPNGSVTDVAQGGTLDLIGGGNYTVKATCSDPRYQGEAEFTFTVTGGKTLTFENLPESAEAGTEITLAAKAMNGDMEDDVPVVFSVQLEGKPVSVEEDGTFVPAYAGEYLITVSADGYDPISETITVTRKAAAAGEVESFDDPLSQSNIHTEASEGTIEWLESYQGATGVIKYTYQTQWPFLTFAARQAKEAYTDDDYLAFRLYFENEANPFADALTKLGNYDTAGGLADYNQTSGTETGAQWRTYLFRIDTFLDLFERFTADNWGCRLWWSGTNTEQGVIYVDEIYTIKAEDLSAYTVYDLGSETFSARVTGRDSAGGWNKGTWLSEYEGENGVIKLTFTNNEWPAMDVGFAGDSMSDAFDAIVFRVYFDVAPVGTVTWNNTAQTVSAGEWTDLTFAFEGFPYGDGNWSNRNPWWQSPGGTTVNVYISSVTLIKTA